MGNSGSTPPFTKQQCDIIDGLLHDLSQEQNSRFNNSLNAQMIRVQTMVRDLSDRQVHSNDSFQERINQQIKDLQEQLEKLKNKENDGNHQNSIIAQITRMFEKFCGEGKQDAKNSKDDKDIEKNDLKAAPCHPPAAAGPVCQNQCCHHLHGSNAAPNQPYSGCPNQAYPPNHQHPQQCYTPYPPPPHQYPFPPHQYPPPPQQYPPQFNNQNAVLPTASIPPVPNQPVGRPVSESNSDQLVKNSRPDGRSKKPKKKVDEIEDIVFKFRMSRMKDMKKNDHEETIADIVNKYNESKKTNSQATNDLKIPEGLILPDKSDYEGKYKKKAKSKAKGNKNWKQRSNYQKFERKASSVEGSIVDSGAESDSSVGSQMSCISQMSCVSHMSTATSVKSDASKKKKVYWTTRENYARDYHFEKAQNQIKREIDGDMSDTSSTTSRKSKNSTNQKIQPHNFKKTNKTTDSKDNNNTEKAIDSKETGGSQPEANLAYVKYPTEEEAIANNSLDSPLTERVLFVGSTDSGTKETHFPTSLRDIYKYEKMYKDFYVIRL